MGIHQFHIPGIMLLKVIADLNSSIYPERLDRIFIVNAPVFFSAAWAIIKLWLDKRIQEKVNVLGSDFKCVLLKHIDHDSLPSFLGGSCTCAHMDGGCVPSPQETIKADPTAFRNMALLKKSSNVHEHDIVVSEMTSLNYKYASASKMDFEIRMKNCKT